MESEGGIMMISYLKKIVKSQKRIYITLISILTILSSFEFILLGIYSCFSKNRGVDNLLLKLIPAIAIFVSFFLTLLINNYFIENKTEEFSIILLSGCKTREVLSYIVIQFGFLFVVSDILGFVLGIALMEGINQIQSYYFDYAMDVVFYTFGGILICKIIYVFLLNFGKFVRIKLDIADYISHHTSSSSRPNYFSGRLLNDNKKHKIPLKAFLLTAVAIILIILSIQGLFDNSNDVLLPIYFMFFLSGEVTLINTTIPLIYDFFHDKKLLKSPRLILILANIIHLSKVLVSMINILACVIPICLSQFFLGVMNEEIKAVTMICFYILLIMILLSFILRFQIYLPSIETDIATEKAIGYQYKQLIFIYDQVVVGFMILIVIIPLVLYTLLLYRAYQLSYITLSIVIILIVSYIVIFTLLAIYMIYQYHRTVKEAYSDVKYLNRSE